MGKGRMKRQFKSFEKLRIVEHIIKNRVRFSLTLGQVDALRQSIEGADVDDLQTIVNGLYSDEKMRRSLMTHLKSDPGSKRDDGFANIGVKRSVKERFLAVKSQEHSDIDISDFLTLVLDHFQGNKKK